MLYPLTFAPIFKERVWGGRKLEELYNKPLPSGVPIGESWEISDRPGDVSIVANGELNGKDLHWLVENCSDELLGSTELRDGRFPLLIKILDAQEKLSLQVHPPASKAAALGGQPKTEMWYIADAAPSSELFVGLQRGVSRQEFERKIKDGTVADCFHRLKVRAGDAMFLPSGRVHAIGHGLVIFEIQENSDTTYRVFDWNRVGLDGKARALHVAESLESINFEDFEPGLIEARKIVRNGSTTQKLVQDPLFEVILYQFKAGEKLVLAPDTLHILAVMTGEVRVCDDRTEVQLSAGGFSLVPASLKDANVLVTRDATFLEVQPGPNLMRCPH